MLQPVRAHSSSSSHATTPQPARARSAAVDQPPITGSVTNSYIVPTRDADIYLEVVEPTLNGKVVKAPVILTYSPYSVLGRNGDADHWVPLGYARAQADVIGTGNSGGCYDYGGKGEQRTGHDSWNGSALARGRPGEWACSAAPTTAQPNTRRQSRTLPHLTTIVPEAAISRWYHYAYSGGIRYTDSNEEFSHEGPAAATDEEVDAPLAFDFGFAIPPPMDEQDPHWTDRVGSTVTPCDELEHTGAAYNLTPDYDGFWRDRGYLTGLHTVKIPVLVASNWGDYNVKQVNGYSAYHALTESRFARMYFGTRWRGHGVPPGAAYAKTVDKWFAHFLKGAPNGLETTLPPVTSQTSDSKGPLGYHSGPEPSTTPTRLYLGHSSTEWTLSSRPSSGGGLPAATFESTGTNTETRAAAQPFADGSYLGFKGLPLQQDIRVFGRPSLHLWSTVEREWVTVTPSLLDFDPARYEGSGAATTAIDSTALVALSRGWLDSRYRNGLDHQVSVTPASPLPWTRRSCLPTTQFEPATASCC